jgi:class 3 adenylate cyclase
VAFGSAFAAEIGEPRGRREFNVLGDVVNTAARLMARAEPNTILLNEAFHQRIGSRFGREALGAMSLKGKATNQQVYRLFVD